MRPFTMSLHLYVWRLRPFTVWAADTTDGFLPDVSSWSKRPGQSWIQPLLFYFCSSCLISAWIISRFSASLAVDYLLCLVVPRP